MTTLNLVAKSKPQERVLAYLQENASDVLAEKINSGTPFEKDGKSFINKKTLDGFMTYAGSEARKLAEKGANSACVEDAVVYGWAIHYFEEDSIEGKLYNEDGTEYTLPKPVKTVTKNIPYTPPIPKPKPQLSMFDLLDGDVDTQEKPPVQVEITQPKEQLENDPSIDEIADRLRQAIDQKNGTHTVKADGKVIDADTGEVLCDETAEVSEATYLLDLLDGKITIA